MTWIAVDTLPRHNGPFLVSIDLRDGGKPIVMLAPYDSDADIWWLPHWKLAERITHWMELPAPPLTSPPAPAEL